MSQRENNPPTPIWSGTFNVFGVPVKCHVLSNGKRIVEAESMNALLSAMANPNELTDDGNSFEELSRWAIGAHHA